MHLKKILMAALMCAMVLASYSFADTQDEDTNEYDDPSRVTNVPITSYWGLRGLTQTVSAEASGEGRFNLSLLGSYFKQKQEIYAPAKDSHVSTMRAALSWGLNDNIDLFGVVPFYILADDDRGTVASPGGIMGGLQYAFAFPEELPFRMGLQVMISSGIRTGSGWDDKDVTTNYHYWRDGGTATNGWDGNKNTNLNYAGYDFWDARKRDQIDLVGKLSQTILFSQNAKLHINEGIMLTAGTEELLFLLAAGIQIDPVDFLTIGVEANLRTRMGSPSLQDPFWITPSLAFRSPYYSDGLFGMSLILGVDICASQAKKVTVNNTQVDMKPLEPWRLFGDVVFSFDRFAAYREELERENRRAAAERERLKREAKSSSAQRDSIARKAREDSLRLANEMAERAHADSIRAKAVADSLAGLMDEQREKARQDSIAQADESAAREAALRAEAEQKRIADSLAFAQQLADERAKRSEQEQMLLSTGMLILADVNFETGRAVLHRNSRPYLAIIAKMLSKYPKLQIEIGGHSDNTGSHQTNMRLSQERADAVRLFMISSEASLANMLTAKGYGPTVPKEDNSTAAGREANRRVEMKVLNPEVLKEYNP